MNPVVWIRLQRILRIVSGALGLGIFISLNVVTCAHVSDELRPRTPDKRLTLNLPTTTPPQVSTNGDEIHELRQGLVLVHLLLVRDEIPLRGQEIRFRWPQDRGRRFVSTGSVDGVSYRFELVPDSVQLGRGTPIYIQGNNQQELKCSSTQHTAEEQGLAAHHVGTEVECDERLPLSLFPKTTHFYRLETVVRHTAPGQPLRKVSVSHYLPRGNTPQTALFTQGYRVHNSAVEYQKQAMRVRWMAVTALLLAVLLLVFGFFRSRQRLLALPLITAACLACVILWDYWAVARARAVLANPYSSVTQLEQVTRFVQRSQFYRNSAHRALQAANRKNKPLRTHDTYDMALARLSGKPRFLQSLFALDVLSIDGTSKTAAVTFEPTGDNAQFTIRAPVEAKKVTLRLRTWLRAYHHGASLLTIEDVLIWDGATLRHKKKTTHRVLSGRCNLRVSGQPSLPHQAPRALVLKRRAICGASAAEHPRVLLGKEVRVTLQVIKSPTKG